MMRIIFYITIICLAYSGTLWSQTGTKIPDYGIWENIHNGDISNDGNWIFYYSQYQKATDTLHIVNSSNKKKYTIPQGIEGAFTSNSQYFMAMTKDRLEIIDLKKDTIVFVENVQRRMLTTAEGYILAATVGDTPFDLKIIDLKNLKQSTIPNVQEYYSNPILETIALITQENKEYSVKIFDLNSTQQIVLKTNGKLPFQNLAWSGDGQRLAFLEERESHLYDIWSCGANQCKNMRKDIPWPKKDSIDASYLEISHNGRKIFFKTFAEPKPDNATAPAKVQVWNVADPWIFPQRQKNGLLAPLSTLWYWQPDENIHNPITDTVNNNVMYVNDQYVLLYDQFSYEPQYKFIADVDMYLMNIVSGEKQLLIDKIKPNEVYISPKGEFIVYFKEGNWWSYNMKMYHKTNLTQGLDNLFYDSENDNLSQRGPYTKIIRWILDEDAILLEDGADIYKITLNGNTTEKLTYSMNTGVKYSLYLDFGNPKKRDRTVVDLKEGLILKALDERTNSGYFIWKEKEGILPLSFGKEKADQLRWDDKMRFFTFRKQDYNKPPVIILFDRQKNYVRTPVKSNIEQNISKWGQPTLLNFEMEDGTSVQGFLIVPVGYNPAKKYPMVVNIYERQTERMHNFFPISWYSEEGFNPAHYALDDYFVLQPDIRYEIGNPGLSALKYVNSAIDHVLEKYNINQKKIGLIGHSFGGYEAVFIATQTNRFATIVAGAAVTNLITFYHAINWNTGQEEMWRMEDFQMRMGGPYFENKQKYRQNSPFHSVENIKSPILLWSGAHDLHIDYNESIRFYLALRRLGKKAKLLLFENEEHSLLEFENRKYLSNFIKHWLDTYCK